MQNCLHGKSATQRKEIVLANINRHASLSRKNNEELFTQTARLFFAGIVIIAVLIIAAVVYVRPTGDVDTKVDVTTRNV